MLSGRPPSEVELADALFGLSERPGRVALDDPDGMYHLAVCSLRGLAVVKDGRLARRTPSLESLNLSGDLEQALEEARARTDLGVAPVGPFLLVLGRDAPAFRTRAFTDDEFAHAFFEAIAGAGRVKRVVVDKEVCVQFETLDALICFLADTLQFYDDCLQGRA